MLLSHSELLPRRLGISRLIRAAWFPFLLMVLCFTGAKLCVELLVAYGGTLNRAIVAPVFILLMMGGLIFLFDLMARVSDYHRYSSTNSVKNSLALLTNLRKSFCSRQVAIALYGDMGRKFYYSLGYRWYHIFPDDVFRKDTVLFKRAFWRTVLRGRR